MRYTFTATVTLEVEAPSLSEALTKGRQIAARIEGTGSAAGARFSRKGGEVRLQLKGEQR